MQPTDSTIAQPPLSRTIRQLERRLKVQLFDRSTRRVELTTAGAALIEPARKLVDASNDAVRTVRDAAAGYTGVVRLGFASASVRNQVSRIVRTVRDQMPGITVDLRSALLSADGLSKVVSREIDCTIGRWNTLPAEVEAMDLQREEIVAVVPATHPFAQKNRRAVSMAELADDDWIVLQGGPGAALQTKFSTLARRAGFTPKMRSTAPDSWTLLVLVASGMGVALTLDTIRDNTNEDHLYYMELKEEDRFVDVQLVWRRDNANPAFHQLLERARELYPQQTEQDGDDAQRD